MDAIGASRQTSMRRVHLVPVDPIAFHRTFRSAFTRLLRPRMRRTAPVAAAELERHTTRGARAYARVFLEVCAVVQRNKLEAFGETDLAFRLFGNGPLSVGKRHFSNHIFSL